jgi:ribosomal protein S18 acetylase RimI-like enzyme
MLEIVSAHTAEFVPAVRVLFREYETSIGVPLCFQSFEEELAGLPGEYAPPDGRLYLALDDVRPAGCVALRKFGDGVCEIKRLYVRPLYRGRGLGRRLVLKLIEDAREAGYECMRLDTLPMMKRAIELYRSLGFRPIVAYREHPVAGALYFELRLG